MAKTKNKWIAGMFANGKTSRAKVKKFVELYGKEKVKCTGADDFYRVMKIVGREIDFTVRLGDPCVSYDGLTVSDLKSKIYSL